MADMVIQFYGVRGTLPVPGKESVRYGGNTNCITLSFGPGHFFIFDAGTGIKALSDDLNSQHQHPIKAKIFITHPHYDHINGIPYFAPLYDKDNDFEFLGPSHENLSIENLISKQMDSVFFPVTVKEFSSIIHFRTLDVGTYNVDGVTVKTMQLNHPGKCLGYRLEYDNRIFCYITDNELCLEKSKDFHQAPVDMLINFVKNADVLIMDTTYSDAEYKEKIGWGHSCVSRVIDVADKAEVKLLCLHHHSPSQLDSDIDLKLATANALLKEKHSKTRCIAPHEGESIVF